MRLEFVEAGYLRWGYIPTISNVDLVREIVRQLAEYKRSLQRVFATDRFLSSGNKKNGFMLNSGCGGESGGLQIEKALLLFTKRVGKSIKSQEYASCAI